MKIKVALMIVALILVAAAVLPVFLIDRGGGEENESIAEDSSLPPLFNEALPPSFSDKSVYLEGKTTGAVFLRGAAAGDLCYLNSLGIGYIITDEVPKDRENYTGSIILMKKEGETAAAALKNTKADGIYLEGGEADAAAAAFLARESGKTVITGEEDTVTVYTEAGEEKLIVCDVGNLPKTEALLDLWCERGENAAGIAFKNPTRLLENENALGDAAASIIVPSLRYNMSALTVGIPSKKSFSTRYANVWLVGGSNPKEPLYLNGKEVNRTQNGLFSVKAELKFGKNELTLQNGDESLTFTVTTSSKYYSTENLASSFESNVGKTAVIDGTACVLLYSEVPVKNNEGSVYAAENLTDVITEYLTSKNEINGKTLELYRLSSGYYVETKYVSVTEKEQKSPSVSSVNAKLSDGWLSLELETEGTPFVTVTGESVAVITVFARGSEGVSAPVIPKNPLFSDCVLSKEEGKTVLTLSLFEGASLFGWECKVNEGKITVRFRLPKRLAKGDKPLLGITVMLDAGHSAFYGGTQGPDFPNDRKERELTYKVALSCKKHLEALGAKVILSRDDKTDKILYASEVKTWYHPNGADVGISIHFNALTETANSLSRSGVLTIYSNSHSKLLSDVVAKNTSLYSRRPFKASSKSDYIICHVPYLPSIIIECGYLTNIFEYDWFLKDENVECFSYSLARSVYDYFVLQDSLWQ